MIFSSFLTRADDEVLQQLLSAKVVRLLRALTSDRLSQGRLRDLLLAQRTPQDLLKDRGSRHLLLDLLRPEEARQLAQLLGVGGTGDDYEALQSCKLSKARLADLLTFFGLPYQEEAPEELSPPTVLIAPERPLFPHQADAARRVLAALTSDPHRVLLHMPTGAGKTRTAMYVIAEHLRSRPKAMVVWLAHSEELCEQAASEFEKTWRAFGDRPLQVHRFWGPRDLDVDEAEDGVVVAGLSKFYSRTRQSLGFVGRLGGKTSMVVMDEAHQAIAPSYQLILDALVEPFPKTGLLGLSATPGRTWADIDQDEQLAEFFSRRKVTLKIPGYPDPVSFLVDQGYLAQVTYRQLFIESGLLLTDGDMERLGRDLEIPEFLLEKLAEDELRNLRILTEIEQLARRHRRMIVFATTVEHSDLLAFTLRARGLQAESVTGRTPPVSRREILARYQDEGPESRILCNFGVLTTGFDAPATSAAVIARPTKSLVLYSQMVGRATRGTKAGGNAEAEIVTVVDRGLPGFGNMAEAFMNWEDVWGEI